MKALVNENFSTIVSDLTMLLAQSPDVKVGEWQAIRGDIPQADTIEIEDISLETTIPGLKEWQMKVQPNLPWAEDHFLERVSGYPHNPPPSSSYWPYAHQDNIEHKQNQLFSHTYPERFYPKYAGDKIDDVYAHQGIRYPYGDLDDVVGLLRQRPGTRQAYLPVWFPEDTGSVDGQRVPCSLGYHFMIRNGSLKIVYYIRSCDFFRHFRDDVYMAGRLCQWVADKLGVTPGNLVMHISSLHVFSVERGILAARLSE